MKLSRLALNPACRQARADLGSPYQLHKTLLRAFPAPLPDDERVLFRVESGRSLFDAPIVLVQSVHPPDWEQITQRFAEYLIEAAEVKDLNRLALENGSVLRFRLRANPSRRVKKGLEEGREKSQRVALYRNEERTAWLKRKGQACGFEVIEDSLNIKPYPQRIFLIPSDEKMHKATISVVDFDGLLRVTDCQALLKGMQAGVGPAKGLGCGLLSLARAC